MTENPECLLRAGTKKELTDLKSRYGKAEFLGIWLPGGVQTQRQVSKLCPFCWGIHVARGSSTARRSI